MRITKIVSTFALERWKERQIHIATETSFPAQPQNLNRKGRPQGGCQRVNVLTYSERARLEQRKTAKATD